MKMLDKKSLARAVVLSLLTTGVVGLYSCNLGYAGEVTFDTDTIVNKDSSEEMLGKITPGDGTNYSHIITVKNGASLTLNDVTLYGPKIESDGNVTINNGAGSDGIVLARFDLPGGGVGAYQLADITAKNLEINNQKQKGDKWNNGIEIYGAKDLIENKIKIDVEENTTIKGFANGVFISEETSKSSIDIKSGSVDIISSGYGVHKEGQESTISISGTGTEGYEGHIEGHINITSGSGGVTNNSDGEITLNSDGNVTIKSLYDCLNSGTGNINVTANNNVFTSEGNANSAWGTTSSGVHARNGDITVFAKENNIIDAGVYGLYGGNVTSTVNACKGNITFTAQGNNTIKAGKDGVKIVNSANSADKTSILVTGANNTIIADGNGLNADNGTIEITSTTGDNIITAGDNAIKVTNAGTATVISVNNTKMTGNVYAESFGQAVAGFNTKDSFLYGQVTTKYNPDADTDEKTKTDLDFTNGSKWYMTGDSNVTNLELSDSIVYMNGTFPDSKDERNPRKLTIDQSLTGGNSTFVMDLAYLGKDDVGTYAADEAGSDFIVMNGTSEGEYKITFADRDDGVGDNLGSMTKDGQKLYFAQVEGNAKFNESQTIIDAEKNGLYDYLFETGSDNLDDDRYNDWFITCTGEKENPNAVTPIHSYNAGFALWRDDDTLLKRLGELRYTNDEGGVWARIIGKKLEMDGAYGFDSNANTVQVGYDRKDVQEDGSGTWRRGIALGYTEADTSFGSGDGENNYADLSLYATNIRKHDHYLDLVARVGNIDSEYDTIYGDNGDFDNWAASISAEYGRKKKMNEDNWFIEPQAQLTYSYMWGDDFTTDKGISVSQENADSLVGRLGFIISREFESERKYPNRIYAKASVLHDFLGESGVAMYQDGKSFYDGVDFGDTWYVVGIGANADMGNNCTFYVDAERAFKADVEMPYRLEAGFRWEF